MNGLIELCQTLHQKGFKYVLLKQIQSDRLECEFSVYSQSTGANILMSVNDVSTASCARLVKFAASFLKVIPRTDIQQHSCIFEAEDYDLLDDSLSFCLSQEEIMSCQYVAGWIEHKETIDFDFQR